MSDCDSAVRPFPSGGIRLPSDYLNLSELFSNEVGVVIIQNEHFLSKIPDPNLYDGSAFSWRTTARAFPDPVFVNGISPCLSIDAALWVL